MIRTFASGRDGRLEESFDLKRARELVRRKEVWVDCENPSRREVEEIGKAFGIHPLSIEDSLNEHQRAKLEEFPGYSYIVIHALGLTEKLVATQLNFFLGENFVVTIHKKPLEAIAEVSALVKSKPLVLGRGADFLAHALLDSLVDDLFPILDSWEDQISRTEDEIFKGGGLTVTQSTRVLKEVFRLKKDLLHVRKAVWPQRETIHSLLMRRFPYIHDEAIPYYRDVYDHLIRITDMIETYRELVTSSMEAYLSVISNNLNVVVKRLTAITVILMVPTLIAGIYGMNFEHIPELRATFGFYEALGLMIAAAAGLFAYLHWKKWI